MKPYFIIFILAFFQFACNKESYISIISDPPSKEFLASKHSCGVDSVHNGNKEYGTVKDSEGNSYKTIKIGSQEWMAENLKTSSYANGDKISDSTTWFEVKRGRVASYNNLRTNDCPYGRYYNWYAVADQRGLCPTGWRVPGDSDFSELINNLGSGKTGQLFSASSKYWNPNSKDFTNEKGLSLIPGGMRQPYESTFSGLNQQAYLVSFGPLYNNYYASSYTFVNTGFSSKLNASPYLGMNVRCIKGTSATLPVLSTTSANSIGTNSATVGGNITSIGGSNITARGVCWNTNRNPTVDLITRSNNGNTTGSFTQSITGLTSNTTYYVRAYATNSWGTAYGNEVSFKTSVSSSTLPILNTIPAVSNGVNSFIVGGIIVSDGGSSITAKGVCWNTSPNPTIILNVSSNNGTGTGSFNQILNGLIPNTTYYVKAYATNSLGTAYGNEISFNSGSTGGGPSTVTDVDGNVYQTVTIGTQVWMKENLKVSSYNSTGEPITTNLIASTWQIWPSGASAVYNNSAPNNTTYGKLYNWYAVADPRGLCPDNWHLPTDADWDILKNFLGGPSVAGGKLKSINNLWTSPNFGATNSSGFSALPGGLRDPVGNFIDINNGGYWWSSTQGISPTYAFISGLTFNASGSTRAAYLKTSGLSVRCLKD